MTEEDIFRIVVPLNDSYSFDLDRNSDKVAINIDKILITREEKIISFLQEYRMITNAKARKTLGLSAPAVRKILNFVGLSWR